MWWHTMKSSHLKLHEPSIKRFREVTWQINILYLLLHQTNGHQIWQVGDLSRRSQPINSHNFLNMWSSDKLKTYIHYHNPYGHKTYQGADIPQGPLTHKFPWPLNKGSDHLRSCGELNKLCLHLQKNHGHKTRQGADLPLRAPNLKVTWPVD